MPLVPHTMDREAHVYRVPGHYVHSTSDILELSGLVDFHSIPKKRLDIASERGTTVHRAIEAYETGAALELDGDIHERFTSFLRFREHADFQPVGPMERSIVYEHEGTGILIGGTPDVVAIVYGQLHVCDFKTSHRTSGKRKEQQHLAWRLQLESYREGLLQDEELWKRLPKMPMHRGVAHFHPKCGIVERGKPRLGYEWNPYKSDDALLWDWCVRAALDAKRNGKQLMR